MGSTSASLGTNSGDLGALLVPPVSLNIHLTWEHQEEKRTSQSLIEIR